MVAAGHGVRFSDRASATSTDRVVAEQLNESAQREWSGCGSDVEGSTSPEEDGSITLDT